jgi:phage tail-like protein
MADFALPVAFHFTVAFTGSDAPDVPDAAFQQVQGLESEIEVETVVEGGENRFVHKLPKPAKHPNLSLKRGLAERSSGLAKWCAEVLEGGLATPIKPKGLQISLCDADGKPVASWNVANAWPVKWQIGGFDAMKNEIAMETVELAYTTLKRSM